MKLEQKLLIQYKTSQELKKQLNRTSVLKKRLLKYKIDLENEIILKSQEAKKAEYKKFKMYQSLMKENNGIIVRFENEKSNRFMDPNLINEINELKLKLEETAYKAKSSFEEWDYLKKQMGTPTMEDLYAKIT